MKKGRELPKNVWYELETLNCLCITNGSIDFEISKLKLNNVSTEIGLLQE